MNLVRWIAILGLSAVAFGARAEAVVTGLANAEDLVVTADGRWVIASAMAGGGNAQGGGLYVVDTKTKVPVRVPLADAPGTATCPGGFRAGAFEPHGITLEASELYVVNHGSESIDRFSVAGPQVRWRDCIPLPKGAFGNGVAVHGDEVFVSNMGLALGGAEGVKGDLLRWSAKAGWRALPGSQGVIGWNGVAVSADGKRLYAAAWRDRKIVEFVLGEAGPGRSMATGFLPDNLHRARDGALLVAGQDTAPDAIRACFFSKTATCGADWGYGVADPARMQWICSATHKATAQFDTATSAVEVGGEMWLGTMRGQTVLTLKGCR